MYQSCISSTNSVQLLIEEYIESQVPKFLSKVKEIGNHFKMQVKKLIWREDETTENMVSNSFNKQPKIFFSNQIEAAHYKIANFTEACLSRND